VEIHLQLYGATMILKLSLTGFDYSFYFRNCHYSLIITCYFRKEIRLVRFSIAYGGYEHNEIRERMAGWIVKVEKFGVGLPL